MQGRQTVTSFNGELEYRPTSALKFDLGLHGYIYNDEERWANASPSFEGNVGVTYAGRKIGFGVEAVMQSCRTWNVFDVEHIAGSDGSAEIRNAVSRVEVPFGVDLRVHFDWHVSNRVILFAEGRNLINRKLYEYLWYPGAGSSFHGGSQAQFLTRCPFGGDRTVRSIAFSGSLSQRTRNFLLSSPEPKPSKR